MNSATSNIALNEQATETEILPSDVSDIRLTHAQNCSFRYNVRLLQVYFPGSPTLAMLRILARTLNTWTCAMHTFIHAHRRHVLCISRGYQPGEAKIYEGIWSKFSVYNYCCVSVFNMKVVPVLAVLLATNMEAVPLRHSNQLCFQLLSPLEGTTLFCCYFAANRQLRRKGWTSRRKML
jgi:hypothetical protein